MNYLLGILYFILSGLSFIDLNDNTRYIIVGIIVSLISLMYIWYIKLDLTRYLIVIILYIVSLIWISIYFYMLDDYLQYKFVLTSVITQYLTFIINLGFVIYEYRKSNNILPI